MTADEQLPYTLAIHAGVDADVQEHNPHAHLMISERQNDGIERAREAWFRRANRADPERGGAPKSRTFHGREWMEHARQRWAALTNEKLEQRGRDERVDHRSYERQGIDREPGHHYGPAAAYMAARGVEHDRLDEAVANARLDDAERALDHHIHELESSDHGGRGGMTHDDEEERKQRQEHKRNDPSPLDDRFLGR